MKTERFTVISEQDGLPLDVLMTMPDRNPAGVVQISHGMSEHKERYLPFMEFLADHGYASVIHDHRGHGKRAGDADSLGYFGEDEDGDDIVADLYQVTKGAKQRFGTDIPFILFGHSMGSLAARKYLKTHDDEVDNVVLSGAPWNNPGAKPGLFVARQLARVKGGKYRSKLVHELADGAFGRSFPENGWLSANEENVKAFNEHPLDGFPFTLNGYMNLFSLVSDVYDKSGWQVKNPDLPVFFVAGQDDPVIGSREKWIEEQDFLKERGYRDVRGTLYPGMRHEILLEKEAGTVMEDILRFITQDM